MKILVAEDDAVSRRVLETTLVRWGHEVELCNNGAAALAALERPDRPLIAVLDVMMPEFTGIEVCLRARATPVPRPLYILMLTALSDTATVVEALEAGADDFVTKPFSPAELRARLGVAMRMVGLESELQTRVRDLEQAIAELKDLRQIIPMCGYCKRVRSDSNFWEKVEAYLGARVQVQVSHGICPECTVKLLAEDQHPPSPHR